MVMIPYGMPPNASVPAETDVLCAHCGYALNGLPDSGRCPECGEPIADSTTADVRTLPPWEADDGSPRQRFFRTTQQIITRPAAFFRSLATRAPAHASQRFANLQHRINAVLLGLAFAIHTEWSWDTQNFNQLSPLLSIVLKLFLPVVTILVVWLALKGITRLASFLTRIEGSYWGYRMPAAAVQRAMHYHAAQLLPVSIVTLLTIGGYRGLTLFHLISSAETAVTYLIVLCVEVVLAAGYLFRTYWIAMKNIMFANR